VQPADDIRKRLPVQRKTFLTILPILLLASTALVFSTGAYWLGKAWGYALGFVFYNGFWCILVPLWLLGGSGFRSLFKETAPLFQKKHWWLILLQLSTTAGALGMLSAHDLVNTPLALALIAIPVALVTGTCEEILWRGVYVKTFPNHLFWGLIYPSLGFAIWHLSPQLVYPASMPGGMFAFAGLTFFLGFCYGLVAYKTGSCKWTAISHSLNGILDIGGALAPAIYMILFSQG
jgi:membrane protease YdiL (CAAX protease family)